MSFLSISHSILAESHLARHCTACRTIWSETLFDNYEAKRFDVQEISKENIHDGDGVHWILVYMYMQMETEYGHITNLLGHGYGNDLGMVSGFHIPHCVDSFGYME